MKALVASTLVALIVALFAIPAFAGDSGAYIEILWPTRKGAGIIGYHGYTWKFGTGCDGQYKRHVGIDIDVDAGEAVYAAWHGHVLATGFEPQWGYFVTIGHTDWSSRPYTTNYHHLNKLVNVGQWVTPLVKIGTIYNLGSNSHLHFGLRRSYYSNVANRGALPKTKSCGSSDPQWPEYTLDPLQYISGGRAPSAKVQLAVTWAKIKN